MSANDTTKPKVFIIETLKWVDEEENTFEGKILSQMLNMSNIESKYYYCRTIKEFRKIIEYFFASNYRYLHISCHGNSTGIGTTMDEEISFELLANILSTRFNKRRLFLSACSSVNEACAKAIIPFTNCYSIMGPKKDIGFDDAVIMWAAFYHLIFKEDNTVMKREKISKNLIKIQQTFNVPFNFFSRSDKNPNGFVKNIPVKINR